MIIGGSKKEVIENIKKNLAEHNYNAKVEVNDAVLSDRQRLMYLLKFDLHQKSPTYVAKNKSANMMAMKVGREMYENIEIKGIENLDRLDLTRGAIITCNHFNPLDSFNVRKLVEKELGHKLYIVIQDTNLAMKGNFGFLMNNLDVLPLSKSPQYIIRRFKPKMRKILDKGGIILIYPEEEMWFNYRKPRPPKRGAFQFAIEMDVPVIPCFVEIRDLKTMDNEEFHEVKQIVHVLKPIFPSSDKGLRTGSREMAEKDYEQKIRAYEKAYHKKLNYDFSPSDIAGWVGE